MNSIIDQQKDDKNFLKLTDIVKYHYLFMYYNYDRLFLTNKILNTESTTLGINRRKEYGAKDL